MDTELDWKQLNGSMELAVTYLSPLASLVAYSLLVANWYHVKHKFLGDKGIWIERLSRHIYPIHESIADIKPGNNKLMPAM